MRSAVIADGDDVAVAQLAPAARLDLGVDGDRAVLDQRARLPARLGQARKLQRLAEADALAADGKVAHPGRVARSAARHGAEVVTAATFSRCTASIRARSTVIHPAVHGPATISASGTLRSAGSSRQRCSSADVVLGGADEAPGVAAGGDHLGVAVVGQDAIGVQVPEALEVGQVAFEAVGLGDVGDGVLQRVAGEQQAVAPAARSAPRRRCGCRRGSARAAGGRRRGSCGRSNVAGGQDERVDPGRAREGARLDRAAAARRAARRCGPWRSPRSRRRPRCRRRGRGASG